MATFLVTPQMNPALRGRVERAVSHRRRAKDAAAKLGLQGTLGGKEKMRLARVLPVVLLGCLLLGVSTAAGYQGRYAATDLADEAHRGRALSIVVWAGTIGAVLGPNLLEFSGSLALSGNETRAPTSVPCAPGFTSCGD